MAKSCHELRFTLRSDRVKFEAERVVIGGFYDVIAGVAWLAPSFDTGSEANDGHVTGIPPWNANWIVAAR